MIKTCNAQLISVADTGHMNTIPLDQLHGVLVPQDLVTLMMMMMMMKIMMMIRVSLCHKTCPEK